ncbi:MAG: protein jag [Actinobacteria bacterium]|nr:protein jag [Actinomycetota bacterium]
MSDVVEEEGNTVDEAVKGALDKLGAERSQVKVEVLREPSRGFLGIGGEKALVRVAVDGQHVEAATALLKAVLDALDLEAELKVEQKEEHVLISIKGAEGLGLLIGRHGETLSALQTVVTTALRRLGGAPRIIVDIEGYRERRLENLEKLAKRAAEEATTTGRPVSLGPMNSYERRAVHLALKEDSEVVTHSEGEEPDREVVVVPR